MSSTSSPRSGQVTEKMTIWNGWVGTGAADGVTDEIMTDARPAVLETVLVEWGAEDEFGDDGDGFQSCSSECDCGT